MRPASEVAWVHDLPAPGRPMLRPLARERPLHPCHLPQTHPPLPATSQVPDGRAGCLLLLPRTLTLLAFTEHLLSGRRRPGQHLVGPSEQLCKRLSYRRGSCSWRRQRTRRGPGVSDGLLQGWNLDPRAPSSTVAPLSPADSGCFPACAYTRRGLPSVHVQAKRSGFGIRSLGWRSCC